MAKKSNAIWRSITRRQNLVWNLGSLLCRIIGVALFLYSNTSKTWEARINCTQRCFSCGTAPSEGSTGRSLQSLGAKDPSRVSDPGRDFLDLPGNTLRNRLCKVLLRLLAVGKKCSSALLMKIYLFVQSLPMYFFDVFYIDSLLICMSLPPYPQPKTIKSPTAIEESLLALESNRWLPLFASKATLED